MQSIIPEEKIRELLPQKYPFVMVNGLLEYDQKKIVTNFLIEKENIFTENDSLNEAGMIENIAQSVALHTGYACHLKNQNAPVGYIGNISQVKLFDFPKLDETIRTEVTVIGEFLNITLVEGKIMANNKTMMTLKMKTFISEEAQAK